MFKNKIFNKADKAAKQPPVFKQDYFNNCHRTYSCIHCRAHLANHDELISKLFQGNHGRAYLFNKVVNIGCKQAVQRELLTGLHAVADIYCDSCETTLGWKYEQAFVASQKYKEGKYIIELVHMLKENNWDPTSYNARELLEETRASNNNTSYGIDNFRFGGRNLIGGSSNYDCNNEIDRSLHGCRPMAINLGQENGTGIMNHQVKSLSQPPPPNACAQNEPKTTKQPHQIPTSNRCQTSENSENSKKIEMKPDDMELLERSIDKLQLTLQESNNNNNNNSSSNIINVNDNNKVSKASLALMVSPSDSLCSSPSQSDSSSALGSVTDSNGSGSSSTSSSNSSGGGSSTSDSTGGELEFKSSPAPDIHEIGLEQPSNITITIGSIAITNQLVGREKKLAELTNDEDPTLDRSATTTTTTATSAL